MKINTEIINYIVITTLIFIALYFLIMDQYFRGIYNAKIFVKDSFTKLVVWVNKKIKLQEQKEREKLLKNQDNKLMTKYNRFLYELKLNIELFRNRPLAEFKICLYLTTAAICGLLNATILKGSFFLLIVPMYLFIVSLLFSFNIETRYKKYIAILNAEILLCADISNGIKKAIEDNINSFDSIIAKEFRDFVFNINNLNYSLDDAIDELSLALGGVSVDFFKKVKEWERNRVSGLKKIFNFIVETNSSKLKHRIRLIAAHKKIKFDFIISLMVGLVFLGAEVALVPFLIRILFFTKIGNMVLVFDFLLIMLVFTGLTYLRAKEI